MGGFGQKLPGLAGLDDPNRLTPEQRAELEARLRQQQPYRFQDPFQQGAEQVAGGWKQLWAPSGTTAADPAFWNKKAQGAADVLAGSAPFAAPLALPALAEAPLATLAGLAIGTATSAGTEAVAEKSGMPPGMAALAGYGAGGVAGGLLGPEVGPAARAAREWYKQSPLSSERGSIRLWTPGTKLKDIPKGIEIPKTGRVLTIHDLGRYFNDRIEGTLGQVPPEAPPNVKLRRILRLGIPEFEDQLSQPDPKLDFYTKDAAQADIDIKHAYPELAQNPVKLIIEKAISAASSPANEPIDESEIGGRIYGIYRDTRKLPLVQPSGKNWPGQNPKVAMAQLQKFIDHFGGGDQGEIGLAQFLMSKHTIAEARQINPAIKGPNGRVVQGSYILGPKVGNYFNDLMGIPQEGSTIDRWEVRANQRRLGDSVRNDKLIDTPLSESDRQVFQEFHHTLADRYKLTRNQAQSGTWHYEKGLYTKLGVKSPPSGRAEGTLNLLQSMGKSRPPQP